MVKFLENCFQYKNIMKFRIKVLLKIVPMFIIKPFYYGLKYLYKFNNFEININ